MPSEDKEQQVQALMFTAAGVVEMAEVPEPAAAPGETLVHVRASGICGSELHGFRSVGMRVPPLVMGHEFAGVTDTGRRVVVNPLLACGSCERCLEGRPHQCSSRGLIGVSRDGGFAECVAVPDTSLVTLPATLEFVAAALVEPLANAVHAWRLLEGRGNRVAVVGGGSIGLLCAEVARRYGAEVVIGETSPQRRALAGRLGIESVENLDGEFDAVIDAVGSPTTRALSTRLLRTGGTAVWVGLADPEGTLDGNALVRGEQRILGSFAYTPDEFAEALLIAGDLDLSWATPVRLADARDTFYSLANGERGIVKAVLVPGDGAL